jgi:hypothetical protein
MNCLFIYICTFQIFIFSLQILVKISVQFLISSFDENWLGCQSRRWCPRRGAAGFREGQQVLLPWFGHGRQVPMDVRMLGFRARWQRQWKLIVNEVDEVLRLSGGHHLLTQEMLHAMPVLMHEVTI